MPLLQLTGITKRFGATTALEHVHLTVHHGEVHALIGENGAGKSTLIKVLTGLHPPDAGTLHLEDRPARLRDPRDAHAHGIRAVHQDRHLVPSFTALENLYLGEDYPRARAHPGIHWARMRERAEAHQASLGVNLPLDRLARDLTPTQRTLLEVLRATLTPARVLLLDEPTASFTGRETSALFDLIGRLTAAGTGIVYVSHRLEEIQRVATTITVLRNGRVAATVPPGTPRDDLIAHMTGETSRAAATARPTPGPDAPAALTVRDLSTRDGRVRHANLTARKGEIHGLYGLIGAGRTELLEAIHGTRARRAGTVVVNDRVVPANDPAGAHRAGLALIPEDRRGHALIPTMSVRENLTLPTLHEHTRAGLTRARSERDAATRWIHALHVKTTGPEQRITELSGGNQQKIVFARALEHRPTVLLCDEPTQAVDHPTRAHLHDLIRAEAARGTTVIVATADLEELLELTDRVTIMRDGTTVATLDARDATPERILDACYAPETTHARN